MKDYADQNYLHARIYAMRGRLFSLKEYTLMVKEEALSDISHGVNDYRRTKEDLFANQIAGIISLAGATEKYSQLIISFLRLYEANNAKLVFAKVFGKQMFEQWYDIGPYAILHRGLLQRQLSLSDIKKVIEGTYLDDVLKDTSSYERIAIRIDVCTTRDLHNASKAFPPDAREILREFAARKLAATSTVWQWRLKENYLWNDEGINTYLEKMYQPFGEQMLERMGVVQKGLHGKIEQIRKSGATLSVSDVEHHLEQDFYSWVSSMFHRDFHSIHCVVAYLWLLFYQIRNMFCIIEARRFNVPPDALFKRLICEA